MTKVRVYQLAKELKVQSVLILELLDRLGREVKSDLSTLDDDTADDRIERGIGKAGRGGDRLAVDARPEQLPALALRLAPAADARVVRRLSGYIDIDAADLIAPRAVDRGDAAISALELRIDDRRRAEESGQEQQQGSGTEQAWRQGPSAPFGEWIVEIQARCR